MTHQMTAQKRLFTFASCLGIVLVQLDVSIVNVGLHSLKVAYSATVADLEWVINAYALVFAALMLSSGSLVDRFGSKNTFITGVAIFIIASVSCAFAPTIFLLDVMRGVQGVGAALLLPGSLTLLRQYFSDSHERSSAIAMWATAGSLALVAGPVAGGVLIKYLGWKSIFLINFPLGLISIAIIYRLAPQSRAGNSRINFLSQSLIAASLALMTYTLTGAGRYGWNNPIIMITLVSAIVLLLLYRQIDKKSDHPVIAREVLSARLIPTAVTIGFLCNLVFYGAVFIFSIFFQNQLHLSALDTGIAFIPMMGLTAAISFCSKWLSSWYPIRNLSLFGSIMTLLGFVIMLFVSPGWTASQLFIPMMLLGSGTSFVMPVMTNLVLSQASPESAGSASAFFNCARQMGGISGVAIFGGVLSAAQVMIHGLQIVALVAAVITVIWVIIGYRKLPGCKLSEV